MSMQDFEKAQTLEEMDIAAREADIELRKMPHSQAVYIARWFRSFYLRAGHKRLGRVLVQYAKETEKLTEKDFV